MRFKPGDRVKFLNESGGGVVTRIISPGMVSVAIEDGFEIPTMISELIRIETEAPPGSPKHLFTGEKTFVDEPKFSEAPAETSFLKLQNIPGKGILEYGLYLAFVPQDQKWLITGLIDLYLVNHTFYDILYNVYIDAGDEGFRGFDYGSCEPSSMVLIDSVDRERLPLWEKGLVQILFHKNRDKKILEPVSSRFQVKMTRFYVETHYKESAIIPGKSILVSLVSLGSVKPSLSLAGRIPDKEAENVVVEAKETEPANIIDKHSTGPREAVVDLHIYELVQDHSGLSNSEILEIQKNYFVRCMESAIASHFQKVTFIHGVGVGTLKLVIREELKQYEGVEMFDASMQEFGYGATTVVIRHNRK